MYGSERCPRRNTCVLQRIVAAIDYVIAYDERIQWGNARNISMINTKNRLSKQQLG